MAEPIRVAFASVPATQVDRGPSAARPPAAATGATRPSARPRPTPRRVGPSFLTRLARLLRLGRIQLGYLTAEDLRVLACLGAALFIALGGQIDLDAPAAAPAGPGAGGRVTTAAQVLDLARAQIGTVEARDGSTPYHRAYGLPADQPWCAVFVWDMFQQAGGADSIHPKTAYTPTLAAWFRERGQWTATPTVGALVFYDWPGDSERRIQHVGIVESFDDSTITAIEGNTSGSSAGSQDDGGGVWRRVRPRNSSIAGYGLPTYSLATSPNAFTP